MRTQAVVLRDIFRVHSTPEGDAAALQGLSLAVAEGEVLCVLGPSGSGKTTLLRVLSGLERPSAGTVRAFGVDVARLPARRLSEYRSTVLGYVEQHYARALAAELTARELVALQLGLRGAQPRERLARADELLERVGLASRRDARPEELSGGEQQRVAVCAALAHRPRLLLADEPTGELDPASAAVVYELIGGLARDEGCTAVIVSHDVEATAIADRTVHIRDGRVSEESAGAGEGAIVVGRGGWLRLPEELLARARIGERARARLEGEALVLSPAGPAAAEPAEPALARGPAPRLRRAGAVVAELRGVSKRYQEVEILSGLDAVFEAGAFSVVTGPSGSGKTTLLRLLAGLELPTRGEVAVAGETVSALDRAARASLRRRHVALVAQQVDLVPFLSARENVELALALRDVEGDRAALAFEALADVGLGERSEQRIMRLSMGERARVAVARALAAGPSLLLADEPTARLDQANAAAVAALFARLAHERGTAIVCATHDQLVIEHADRELALGRRAI